MKIFHIDLYRVEKITELSAIGLEEYLQEVNSINFIEWPEKITNLLHEKLLQIHIESEANMRIFTIEEIKS